MQFKKNRAILAAVVAAAMTATAMMSTVASAAKEEKYGDDTYEKRFLSLYDDVINNGVDNGYLSGTNVVSGGFGVPYHSVEELICEAPDYGHETTSEAMSYIVWIAAMHDNITKKSKLDLSSDDKKSHLAMAWKTLEALIPTEQTGIWTNNLSSRVADEHPDDVTKYPSEGNDQNVGKNPIHDQFKTAYSSASKNGEYLMHWLADVDDWYGFGGTAAGSKGKIVMINTFQRGDQESCFETVPHPSVETKKYGTPQLGMKFAFQTDCSESWSYTNAPDAEDRAIQAVYAANRWGVGDADVTAKAGMMGDMCRNDMFDKYYKTIGCQSKTDSASGGGLDGQHFLMSWYTAWGGDLKGQWAWQIGCSHSHQFYQNPLAAYGLLYDSGLSAAMKTGDKAIQDYTTSLQRQVEFYLWLQSAEGPFAGGCTNCWDGNYSAYPSGRSTFHKMAYVEHPVYADPGSNHWTGNQFWATQRLAELYYLIKTDGDKSSVKPGGLSLEKALQTVLDKWVAFFVEDTKFTDDGDFELLATLNWEGQPATWDGTYSESANKDLHAIKDATGNADFGCAASLADTCVYYAKANGVEASGTAKEGSTLPEKALYTAQQLMDRLWAIGRDDIGVSRVDHNKSLARFFEQEVYIPTSAGTATYPHGYEVKNGSKFIDLRKDYENVPGFKDLEAAWKADNAAGAKYDDSTSDCSQFENVGKVDLKYHRFWHVGDVLMTLGTINELYPELKPSGSNEQPPEDDPKDADWGNVDCSTGDTVADRVNVADAVMLARYNAEDKDVKVTSQGLVNAQCCWDKTAETQKLDANDLSYLLEYLAGLKKYSELGNQ